jgi:DNA-binding transcriptional MerR regulator
MAAFSRHVGLSPPIIRGLEAAGVVNPIKTDSGWRAFSPEDVQRARAWKAERKAAKAEGAKPERQT